MILWINDPKVPIEYSEILKSYNFKYSPGEDIYSSLRIDYCPSCGGKANNKEKNSISKKELTRLRKLTEKISTFKDAVKILGKPDNKKTSVSYEWREHSLTAIIDGFELHPNKFFVVFRKK